MSIVGKYTKQPAETETYTISYKDDLTAGDEIVSATARVIPDDPDGLDLFNVSHSDDRIRVWVRNGVDRAKYKIEVTVNTGDGRILQDEFYITIKEY